MSVEQLSKTFFRYNFQGDPFEMEWKDVESGIRSHIDKTFRQLDEADAIMGDPRRSLGDKKEALEFLLDFPLVFLDRQYRQYLDPMERQLNYFEGLPADMRPPDLYEYRREVASLQDKRDKLRRFWVSLNNEKNRISAQMRDEIPPPLPSPSMSGKGLGRTYGIRAMPEVFLHRRD